MDTQNATLPEVLKPYRTQAVAEALGVSQVQATAYKGGRSFPGPDKYEALAAFLKVDVGVVVRLGGAYRASQVA